MRIGIDARLLSVQLAGIGRYTAELSRELLKQDGMFFFYMPSSPAIGDWHDSNSYVRSSAFGRRIGKMLWAQSVLPYWAAKDDIDVFWGTTHRLPRFLPQRIARVVTIHDLVWKHAGDTMRPLSRWLDSRLMPEAIRLADRVIAVSQSTADAIDSEFPAVRSRVRVIHPGIAEHDQCGGNIASLAVMGITKPYFLFVGTIEPRKNLRRLFGAFSKLPADIRARSQLVVAGGKGWGGIDISALIAEYGLKRDVIQVGYVSDQQLFTLYANARFLAMPSLYEGFGLPLAEAMSCGIPVLTSNCSSLPEVAGDAGLLVDPMSEDSIMVGLMRLLIDDALRDSLAARARLNAARFSWSDAAAKTRAVLEEAVIERRSRNRYLH